MKDVVGYEGLYGITSCGKVWSYRRNRFLDLHSNCKGYLQVGLTKDGKRRMLKVHRLVAEAYIPNPNNYKTVDHIDSNRRNNCVNNLQWMTQRDNVIKGRGKPVICINTGIVYKSISEAAAAAGCEGDTIARSIKNNRPSRAGLWWKLVEES